MYVIQSIYATSGHMAEVAALHRFEGLRITYIRTNEVQET